MPDIMTLIDMKPLGYPTRFGIDPKQTHGTACADLSFKVPMLRDLSVDAVGISVKAQVNDFAVTLGHLKLDNGTVNFEMDNSHLHEAGTVSLADARLAMDWQEDFKTGDPITTRINAKGTMTDAARQALNVGLAEYPARAGDGQRRSCRAIVASFPPPMSTMDLTNAALVVPILHLGKQPGQAAAGHIQVNFAPGDVRSR